MCSFSNTTQSSAADGAIAPGEHVVRIYEDSDSFMDSLVGFAAEGLRAGEVFVAIATMSHLFELESRLRADRTFQFATLQSRGQYIRMNAHEALWQFMRDGHPDETLFRAFLGRLIGAAFADGRTVRAFGEMVVILLDQGNLDGVLELERLWHRICEEKHLTLYCAYPTRSIAAASSTAHERICASHSRTLQP